jgi:hypothetical protein
VNGKKRVRVGSAAILTAVAGILPETPEQRSPCGAVTPLPVLQPCAISDEPGRMPGSASRDARAPALRSTKQKESLPSAPCLPNRRAGERSCDWKNRVRVGSAAILAAVAGILPETPEFSTRSGHSPALATALCDLRSTHALPPFQTPCGAASPILLLGARQPNR